MVGEGFAAYGLTELRISICMLRLDTGDPEALRESQRSATPLPALHSSWYAPVPGPTIRTGITTMSAAAIDVPGQGHGR